MMRGVSPYANTNFGDVTMSVGIEIASLIVGTSAINAAEVFYKYLVKRLALKRKDLPLVLRTEKDVQIALEILAEEDEKLDPTEADKTGLSVVEATTHHIDGIREERLRQAKSAFNAALGLAVIGVLVVLAGVILLLVGNTTAGVITAASGITSEVISAVLFVLNRDANDRLDGLNRDLQVLERARYGMEYIDKIENPTTKDAAIRSLASDLRQVPAQGKRLNSQK